MVVKKEVFHRLYILWTWLWIGSMYLIITVNWYHIIYDFLTSLEFEVSKVLILSFVGSGTLGLAITSGIVALLGWLFHGDSEHFVTLHRRK